MREKGGLLEAFFSALVWQWEPPQWDILYLVSCELSSGVITSDNESARGGRPFRAGLVGPPAGWKSLPAGAAGQAAATSPLAIPQAVPWHWHASGARAAGVRGGAEPATGSQQPVSLSARTARRRRAARGAHGGTFPPSLPPLPCAPFFAQFTNAPRPLCCA